MGAGSSDFVIGMSFKGCPLTYLADMSRIKVYTDGSSIEGQIGVVAVLYWDGVLKRKKRLRLGLMKHHTVYKGEGIGLLLGLELIREEEDVEGLIIGINNTAAIKVIHTIKPCPSHYIWDLFHQRVSVLSNRHKRADILIRWTPGHMGITGNKRADEEAKKAAREGLSPSHRLPAALRKTLPRSKSAAQQEFNHKLKLKAADIWRNSTRYGKMERIDANYKASNFTKLTHNLHHDQASLLFQLRSEHIPLNMNLHKIK